MTTTAKVEAFVWSAKLETGNEEVDKQHQQLVKMINEIGEMCSIGAEGAQIKQILDQLVNYAVYHFETEEKMMLQYAVSPTHQAMHLKAHEDFRKQVSLAVGIIQASPQSSIKLLAELLEYLARWLLQHIMVIDLRMVKEIQALQSGATPEVAVHQAAATTSRSGDVMAEALNTLYGKIGEQTVQVMEANRALEREKEALRELNSQLEQRVQQRTAALESSNQQLSQSNNALTELNQKLANTQNQLVQAEKMASVGQLAAGVAHEINNPIGFVNSNLNTLEQYISDINSVFAAYSQAEKSFGHEALAAVNTVKEKVDLSFLLQDISNLLSESQDGLRRVKRIVQDLRNFSHVEAANWQLTNIEQGLNSTINVALNEIKYKAEIVRLYAGIPEIQCMPSEINQVFLNLLVNAAQAIETHGTITIRTGVDKDQVWIDVVDTGKGIAPDNLKQIFDPFFTTKPVGSGTGLGLSVSYGIVQKHGGRIVVHSALGKGTSMRVWLPIKQKVDS